MRVRNEDKSKQRDVITHSFILPNGINKIERVTHPNGDEVIFLKKWNRSCISKQPNRRHAPPRAKRDPNARMSVSNHNRLRGRKSEELLKIPFQLGCCVFGTFTTRLDKPNDYPRLLHRLKRTINKVKDKVGKEYVGRVWSFELTEKGRIHIHAVLVFKSESAKVSQQELERFWSYGGVVAVDVYDIYGLADYITNLKYGVADPNNPTQTIFKAGSRPIDIWVDLPKAKSETIYAEDKELYDFYDDDDTVVFLKRHNFNPENSTIDRLVFVKKSKKGGVSN